MYSTTSRSIKSSLNIRMLASIWKPTTSPTVKMPPNPSFQKPYTSQVKHDPAQQKTYSLMRKDLLDAIKTANLNKVCSSYHNFSNERSALKFLSRQEFWAVLKLVKKQTRIKHDPQLYSFIINIVTKDMPEAGVPIQTHECNLVLDAYIKSGLSQKATELITWMKSPSAVGNNTCVDLVTYNTLIDFSAKAGKLEQAQLYFDDMCQSGIPPDAITYSSLINGAVLASDLPAALEYHQKMLSDRIRPDTVTYSTLIKGFAQHGKTDEAKQLLRDMVVSGLKPNIVTYCSLINGCIKSSDLAGAKDIFQEMVGAGIQPNLIAFNTLLNGITEHETMEEAMAFYDHMLNSNVKPDVVTFTTLIKGYLEKGRVEEAEMILHDMKQMGVYPNSYTYHAFLQRFSKHGPMEKAEAIFREMTESRVQLSVKTFTTLLLGYIHRGLIDTAISCYYLMASYNIHPNVFVFELLCHGLSKPPVKPELLRRMEHEMIVHNIDKSKSCFHSLIRGYFECEEYKKVVEMFQCYENQFKSEKVNPFLVQQCLTSLNALLATEQDATLRDHYVSLLHSLNEKSP